MGGTLVSFSKVGCHPNRFALRYSLRKSTAVNNFENKEIKQEFYWRL